jgi:hypothetical protein
VPSVMSIFECMYMCVCVCVRVCVRARSVYLSMSVWVRGCVCAYLYTYKLVLHPHPAVQGCVAPSSSSEVRHIERFQERGATIVQQMIVQ